LKLAAIRVFIITKYFAMFELATPMQPKQ